MSSYRTSAWVTGVLFLISDVAAIVGLLLYQPLLADAGYITTAGAHDTQVRIGAFLEVLLAVSVAGTALALYPLLKRQNQGMALGYVIGRAAEGVIILAGVMSLLTVLTLRQGFVSAGADAPIYQAIGRALVEFHAWTFLFGPNIVLSLNATLLGYLLYASRVVPRWIAWLALIDGPILFVSGIAILFGAYEQTSPFAAVLALPMLVFEVSLAIRLIVKGFDRAAVAALESRS